MVHGAGFPGDDCGGLGCIFVNFNLDYCGIRECLAEDGGKNSGDTRGKILGEDYLRFSAHLFQSAAFFKNFFLLERKISETIEDEVFGI